MMTQAANPHTTLTPPAFPGGAPTMVSPSRTSALSVARFRPLPSGSDEYLMPPEDAYVALVQLRPHPAHELRMDGRVRRIGPSPQGGLHFMDLRGAPLAYLREPVDTLMFHIPRAVLDELADDAGAPRIAALAAPEPWRTIDPVVGQLQDALLGGLSSATRSDSLLHQHLMLGVAGHFATAYGGLRLRTAALRGGLAPWQARRAKELLAADLAKELSLDDIARACDLSTAYFGRAFKVSEGASPHSWRQARRVECAQNLLASQAPLAEIAVACGFADQSHFSRVFAHRTGRTPGAWRRQRHDS